LGLNFTLLHQPEGRIVACLGESIHLEESRNYELVFPLAMVPEKVSLDGLELQSLKPGYFHLETGFWVGNSSLCVHHASGVDVHAVKVTARPEKLTEVQWISMLCDIESSLGPASVGLEGVTHGHIGREGISAQFLVTALEPLVPSLVKALVQIIDSPRLLLSEAREQMPLHHVHRVDRETLRWVVEHADVQPWLDPWNKLELTGQEPTIPQSLAVEDLNHPVNRYVSWITKRVVNHLRETATALEAQSTEGLTDEWLKSRAGRLRNCADRLWRLWKGSFLSRLEPMPPSETVIQAVADDPTYARFHSLCRLFLSPRFSLNAETGLGAMTRPSYGIYEIWCFVALWKGLCHELQDWHWQADRVERILSLSGSGSGARIVWKGPEEQMLELEFNPVFAGYFARKEQSRWSISGERRPDFVVTYKRGTVEVTGRWLCLDAKYRVGRQNLAEAMSSVHIYRDSLRYESYGGRCCGAFLLSPNASQECEDWFSDEFAREHHVGVKVLAPGTHSDFSISRFICDVLSIYD
jgi:hypothetical protein